MHRKSIFSQRLGLFNRDTSRLLLDGNWGLEKESQRVTASGELAMTDHPAAFGNKLGNPHITVDFAESQIELITSPYPSVEEAFEELNNLQLHAEEELREELLWPLSMPPKLPAEEDIPLARFGDSEEGREKEVYRTGLSLRYGKKMQMVSGIHYNFSFGDMMLTHLYSQFGQGKDMRSFTDELYAAVARNFLRYRWLLIYLFGASPSIDSTYYSVMCQELQLIAQCCPESCRPIASYEKSAASLRVSRFGYSRAAQGNPIFNSLEEYTQGIRKLLSIKHSKFSRLGTHHDGRKIQLNGNILQKESEFYSSIRLKQVTEKGESQLNALEGRGVKYVEVRILDLNPFFKTGMDLNQLYFLQVFMLYCLLEDSAIISEMEAYAMNRNHHLVSLSGRKPNLQLYPHNKRPVLLKEWAEDIFRKLRSIASVMDMADSGSKYHYSVEQEYNKVLDPSLLPSARIHEDMEKNKESYLEFGVRWAQTHKAGGMNNAKYQ
jgi:glutamate--cysteine ligase